MHFNKNTLAAIIASTMVVGTVHAAISSPTLAVIGHLPTMAFIGTMPTGDLELGKTLTFANSDFRFEDVDGDTEATHSYVWQLDGVDTSNTTLVYPLELSATGDIGKNLKLVVIPKTSTGDPTDGNPLVLDFGSIVANSAATPSISALTMTGTLRLGQQLSATYTFAANGGDPTDESTYAWGRVGDTAAAAQASTTSVTTAGVVDSYTLTNADVGQVVELSVQPRNSQNKVGNIATIDSTGLSGGGSGGEVINPTDVNVRISHPATGTEALNGPNFAGRPVAGKDLITAECKWVGAPDGDYTTCSTTDYSLQWKSSLDGTNFNNIAGQTGSTYTPDVKLQGQRIAVEATVKTP